MKQVQNRYQLVLIAARRANELISGAPPLLEAGKEKISIVALHEIAEGKVRYEVTKESKKSKS